MDATNVDLAIYLTTTFAAALVTGVAGFAFGLVAAAVWLHILTPIQTATLIIAFGLVVQGISVWKLRHALRWRRLWPFLFGAAFGVPLGVAVLGRTRPDHVRVAVGAVLVLYSVYSLARPAMQPVKRGDAVADAGVGFLNGVLGGLTGLAGSHDGVVRHSRLAQGRAARGLSADWRRDFRNERPVAGSKRRNIDRHGLVLRLRPSGIAGRDVGRAKALRTFGRSRLSQDRASPVVGVGNCAGSASFRITFWLMAHGREDKQQT
jgi:Sulfite exporter TauE/SafE